MLGSRYDRNIGVWDEIFQEKLKDVTVGLAGLGGSGGCLVSILARNGFGRFKIADPDVFERHNIQRQIYADENTLDQNKTDVTALGINAINPDIEVISYPDGITEDNLEDFLQGCDFVHEVMDYSIPELKISFHRKARELGIVATTSIIVGTGVSTFAFDPKGMSFEEYFEYPGSVDGWNLSHDKLVGVDPDYLDREKFLSRVREGTVPTTADGAFLTGITTAALYKRILLGKDVGYAPKMLRIDFLDDKMYERSIL